MEYKLSIISRFKSEYNLFINVRILKYQCFDFLIPQVCAGRYAHVDNIIVMGSTHLFKSHETYDIRYNTKQNKALTFT